VKCRRLEYHHLSERGPDESDPSLTALP
jgi:hypothetical protein